MPSLNSKLRLICAFAALATLALAVSCRGFFVKPTLSSLVVTPATPSIDVGATNNTVQMSVFATFNDGSTGSTPVTWSTSDASVAKISTSGLVTAVTTGSATITAAATQNPTITGEQTVTVTICVQSIQVTPSSPAALTLAGNNPSDNLTAEGTPCGGGTPVPITDVATWTSSNQSLATVTGGVVTEVSTNTTTGTVNITASSGNVTSNVVTIQVGP
jgi:hypothetical protein